MLLYLSELLRDEFGFLNVFRYVSTRVGLATLTSLLITFGLAPWFIRRARSRQLGEVIRDLGETSHTHKQGTPTMGGALIILALVTGSVLWCDLSSPLVLLAMFVTVGYGLLGFADDYLKIAHGNKKGVSARIKLLVQFSVGGIAVVWLFAGGVGRRGPSQVGDAPCGGGPMGAGAAPVVISGAGGVRGRGGL